MDPIESIFRDVAQMTPAPPSNEDPYQSEEYAKFVASMVPHCHCAERYRPCDGVLAGGVCDGMTDDRPYDPERDEEDEE